MSNKISIQIGLDEVLVASVLAEAHDDASREELLLNGSKMVDAIRAYVEWGLETRLDSTKDQYREEAEQFEMFARVWLKQNNLYPETAKVDSND